MKLKKSLVLVAVFLVAFLTGVGVLAPDTAWASLCESDCQDAWEACYGDCILNYPAGTGERRVCWMQCDYQRENCLALCGW